MELDQAEFTYHHDNEEINLRNKDEAIDQLMNLYSEKVYLLAYSFVKDKGLAEDISQEVFIKCYRHLHLFRGEASIKSWIYRITVNTSKDFIKKKSFKLLKFPLTLFENMTKNESSEDLFLKDDENEQLLQHVLSLPEKYREIIILHYFHDLKVEEIGEALQLNANTVKTRLSRGRSILKDNLNQTRGDVR